MIRGNPTDATPREDSPMKIREFERDRDLDGFRRCALELQGFEHGLDPRIPDGASIIDRYLDELLDDLSKRTSRIFVAEVDGEIAGYAFVLARVRSEDLTSGQREYDPRRSGRRLRWR